MNLHPNINKVRSCNNFPPGGSLCTGSGLKTTLGLISSSGPWERAITAAPSFMRCMVQPDASHQTTRVPGTENFPLWPAEWKPSDANHMRTVTPSAGARPCFAPQIITGTPNFFSPTTTPAGKKTMEKFLHVSSRRRACLRFRPRPSRSRMKTVSLFRPTSFRPGALSVLRLCLPSAVWNPSRKNFSLWLRALSWRRGNFLLHHGRTRAGSQSAGARSVYTP